MDSESPFFDIPQSDWIAKNRSAFAVWDGFPVSPGHALVVSRRLISDWWEATPGERADMFDLVDDVRRAITDLHHPDGFNVGFNAGAAAGQTVDHLHIHVIPRFTGDVDDPRGGVRHVIAAAGNYLTTSAAQHPPVIVDDVDPRTPVLVDGQVRLLQSELIDHLRNVEFDHVDIAVSFIKMSGLNLVMRALEDALDRGVRLRVLTTDYLGLTEPDALVRLLDLQKDNGEAVSVRVFHDPQVSFHPKAYLFYSAAGRPEAAFVGSSNLSRSALSGGIEWNLLVGSIQELKERFLVLWLDGRSLPLTDELIAAYEPAPTYVPEAIEVVEPPVEPPQPRPIQQEALRALAQTRSDGYHAGMVTMATGLGKTWLAAFDVAQAGVARVLFIAHREEILKQSRDVFRMVMPTATMGLYTGMDKQPDADFVFATVQTLSGHLEQFPPESFDYVVIDEFHHAAASTYRLVIDHFRPRFLLGLTATPERMDGADLLSLCADNSVFSCDLVEGIRRDELVPFHYWGVPDPVDFEPIPWRNGRFDPAALEVAFETQERAESAFSEWQSRRGTRTLAFCASKHHSDFMSRYFQERGVRCASVHSGPSSAPRHQSIDDLRSGELEVIFTVDLFNEGLDVPEIDTVLMLRPTESPTIFLQQLGRGLRIREGKDALTVIDFIGNHRSFILKPRTLLALSKLDAPTTLQVFLAMENGDFDLPEGCSVNYELTVVDMLRELSRSTASDAIEEYCRSYLEDEGLRPTATQAFRAGHDPAVVTNKYGSWFGFLRFIDLLGERESEVVDAYGATLKAIQTENITKSYKLVAMRALLHDGRLRSGGDVDENAETARRLLLADPRLARDVPAKEFPNLAEADAEKWSRYWRKWPLAHLSGVGDGSARGNALFRLDERRIAPNFTIGDDNGDVFDSMVAEIVEYRIASYVLNKEKSSSRVWPCRLVFVDGDPVIRLDRRQSPDLPTGAVSFIADDVDYEAAFDKGTVASAIREGAPGNALPGLLRRWFGPSAGHPGTSHRVLLEQVEGTFLLRPDESGGTNVDMDYVPLLEDFSVAYKASTDDRRDQSATEIALRRILGRSHSPTDQFVCFARDDSMAVGDDPIRKGDPLLFAWIDRETADDLVDQTVLVSAPGPSGDAGSLKVLRRRGGTFVLEAHDADVAPVAADPNLQPVARLVAKLGQDDINPLAARIGEQFKSMDVPPLYGEVYNPGNWRAGHVSLDKHAILFVTLEKRADRTQYTEHFEGPDVFVWSSQLSTKPTGKKGREILESLSTGKSIELWMRRRSADPFTYVGRAVPLGYEGSEPMLVTYRLLTPLTSELQSQLGISST